MKKLVIFETVAGTAALAILCVLGSSLMGPSFALSRNPISQERLDKIRAGNPARHARHLAVIEELAALRETGKLQEAGARYQEVLRDPQFENDSIILLSYAELLEGMGKRSEAMEVVKPLIFRGSSRRVHGTLLASSDFHAVDFYTRNIRIMEGKAGLEAFRNQIRDNAIDGFSLRDLNNEGLTDDEAMDYIRGRYAGGRQNFAETLKQYQKVARNYPPSFMFYSSMKDMLFALHREKEVIPLFEDWYRHSSPEMKAEIKKRCFLDFKRLDAEGSP